MNVLFGNYINPLTVEAKKNDMERWQHIREDEPLTTDKFLGKNVVHRFEKTVTENIQMIEEFIKQIHRINPECKIIFTLILRYITMEKTLSVFMENWKQEFESITMRLQMQYRIYFFNYKDRTEISENSRF